MGLNQKQRKFADGVLAGKTPADAYKAAGYRAKNRHTAEQAASRLLRNVEVRRYVAAANRKAAAKAEVTAEWVTARLRAFAGLTGKGASLGARVRAVELLGKRIKYFPTEALELTGLSEGPLEVKVFIPANDRDTGEPEGPHH